MMSGTSPPGPDQTLPGNLPPRPLGVAVTSSVPYSGGDFGGNAPGLEGGSTTRRLISWRPSSEHINSLLRAAGPTTVSRARWLARNNGYAKAAVRSWRSATVGAGIKPSSLILDRATREAVNLAWLDWTDEADAEGVTDLYGIQRRVAGEAFLAGECFVRLRRRRPEDNLSVPLQLQVMPSEQLPLNSEWVMSNGNRVRMGIEFNANVRDRREAYWFWRSNPSDLSMNFHDAMDRNLLTRVPANEMLHVYDPGEAGQIRGFTSFGAAMVKMFHLDLYDDAELERKKQAARHAAVITKSDNPELDFDDSKPFVPQAYGPGTYIELDPGEDIKFTEPSEVGGSYEPFQYRTLLAMASGLGIPYGELSHDLTKANYASSRAGLVAFRIEIEAFQYAVLVFQFLRRAWNEWLAAAVLAGAVPITAAAYKAETVAFRRAKFITPKLPWVDPAKDARGEEIMVNNGWKSRSDVIESLGSDPEETDLRIAADREREQRLGLSFPEPTRTVSASVRGRVDPNSAAVDELRNGQNIDDADQQQRDDTPPDERESAA